MISDVQDEEQSLLRFLMLGGNQRNYEWSGWSERLKDVERWQDFRDHLLAVEPSGHGETLAKAHSLALSFNARLACTAAFGAFGDKADQDYDGVTRPLSALYMVAALAEGEN
jgi:hypothetical protein